LNSRDPRLPFPCNHPRPSSVLTTLGESPASNGPVYDTTAVSWLGGGTLTIAQDTGGNRDTFLRISNGNLTVSAASGLALFNAMPWRA